MNKFAFAAALGGLAGLVWLMHTRAAIVSDPNAISGAPAGTIVRVRGRMALRANFNPPPGATYAIAWDMVAPNSGGQAMWVVGTVPRCIVGCEIEIVGTIRTCKGCGAGFDTTYIQSGVVSHDSV